MSGRDSVYTPRSAENTISLLVPLMNHSCKNISPLLLPLSPPSPATACPPMRRPRAIEGERASCKNNKKSDWKDPVDKGSPWGTVRASMLSTEQKNEHWSVKWIRIPDGFIANYVNPSGYNPRKSRGKSGEVKGERSLRRVNLAHPFVAPEEMHAYSILITNRPRGVH